MIHYKRERKFLIDPKLQWYAHFKLKTSKRFRIFETLLCGRFDDKNCAKVFINYDDKTNGEHFSIQRIHQQKKAISKGVWQEEITELGKAQLDLLITNQVDPSKNKIQKSRYHIEFNKKIYMFDLYEEKLLNLATLKIRVPNYEDEVLLPPYFDKVREITDDKTYSSMNLATIEKFRPKL